MPTIGIYFPDETDANAIRARLSEISAAHGLGRGPGPLLAAIANGSVTIRPTTISQDQADIPADLPGLLRQSAAALRLVGHSRLAEALEGRATRLEDVYTG